VFPALTAVLDTMRNGKSVRVLGERECAKVAQFGLFAGISQQVGLEAPNLQEVSSGDRKPLSVGGKLGSASPIKLKTWWKTVCRDSKHLNAAKMATSQAVPIR
jgi:hypothetical protein